MVFVQHSLRNWGQLSLTGSVCVCSSVVLRFGGLGFDKVWDRVQEIVRGNFHGSPHRRHHSGVGRHAGRLRGGTGPDPADGALMTTSLGKEVLSTSLGARQASDSWCTCVDIVLKVDVLGPPPAFPRCLPLFMYRSISLNFRAVVLRLLSSFIQLRATCLFISHFCT